MSQTIILKHDGASRLWIRFGQSRFVRSFNLRCFSKLPPKVAPFKSWKWKWSVHGTSSKVGQLPTAGQGRRIALLENNKGILGALLWDFGSERRYQPLCILLFGAMPKPSKKSTIGLGYFSVRLIFTARARLPERYYNGYYWLWNGVSRACVLERKETRYNSKLKTPCRLWMGRSYPNS